MIWGEEGVIRDLPRRVGELRVSLYRTKVELVMGRHTGTPQWIRETTFSPTDHRIVT